MQEIANTVANYGVSMVLVVLFIWDWFKNKQDIKDTLEVIKDTSVNISKSLDLLQKSMENNNSKIDKHDERITRLLESMNK